VRGKILKYSLITLALLLGGGIVLLYYFINPADQEVMPKCMFHSTTGLHCPGCGSQRALHSFLQGNIIQGFKYNLLIGAGILVLLYKVFLLIRAKFYPEKRTNLLYNTKTPWIILSVILIFWLLRNIPFEPFSYLAP